MLAKVVLVLVALVVCCGAVCAEGWGVQAGADLFSAYLWRGFLLCDHPVVQPSVTLTQGDTYFNIWSNFAWSGDGKCTEIDYAVSQAFPLGTLSGTAGFIYYTFPNLEEADDSREVFLRVTRPGKLPLHLTGYYDFGNGNGLYVELGAEAPVKLKGKEGSLKAALGYNQHQWRPETGFSQVQVVLCVPYTVGGQTSISPIVGYSYGLADQFPSVAYVGLSATSEL